MNHLIKEKRLNMNRCPGTIRRSKMITNHLKVVMIILNVRMMTSMKNNLV